MGLLAKLRWVGGYVHTKDPAGNPRADARIGQGSEPAGVLLLSDGTGPGQANQVFAADFTIGAGATQIYDLRGAGGEKDVLNDPLAMTAVKLVLVEITGPAAGKGIRFGPDGNANAAQLWFPGAGAGNWQEELDKMMKCDARAGWALDATHKVIAIKNPGADPVSGKIRVIGTK